MARFTRLIRLAVHSVERLARLRATGAATRAAGTLSDQLRSLEDKLPAAIRRVKPDEESERLSPSQLSKIYAQLPDREKLMITEHVKVAASDALTTLEGIAPRGEDLTRRVVGRLVFQFDGPDGKPRPLHNMRVELWDRDFGSDDILGIGTTDRQGHFEIWYDPADAGWERPDLDLRVYEVNHLYKHGKLQFSQSHVYTVAGEKNVSKPLYDFGVCRVPYWEYNKEAKIPRLLIVDNSAAPQSFSLSRSLVMAGELATLQWTKTKHLAKTKVNPNSPTIAEIQSDYPDNMTVRLERKNHEDTRGDEFFGERILNGMAASILDRDPENRNRFWLHYHWNSYEQDGKHAAPDVDIYLELKGEKIVPVEICLRFREGRDAGVGGSLKEKETYTKEKNPEEWQQAKRVARVSAALHAELDVHLAQTHLNVEQYAIAAYRNLRKSPIRPLLMPHLNEVVLINQEADRWLLGENGFITRSQALTSNAIDKRLREVMGTLDWKNWKPRKQIAGCQHTYAEAAALFWKALEEYVDGFFIEHERRINKYWYEVLRFSQDLVDHSVPFYLCPHLQEQLLDDGKLCADADWYEMNERIDLNHHPTDNNAKAITPIASSDEADEEGIENLKQVCRYVIFHATFFHDWTNSRQLDDCGEIVYSGLGLRYGDNGVMCPESDHSVAPPPELATEQLWFANALTRTSSGYIMNNESRDIPPGLSKALRTREAAFAKLGVITQKIPARLNI